MTRLSELLPFNDGETVESYCSRLAAACGYQSARALASRLGFTFRDLALGRRPSLQRFAAALDTSEASLADRVVTKVDRDWMVSGERFSVGMTCRSHLRVCPHCILEDELTAGGRRGFRAFGRLEWLVTPISVCRQHESLIFTLQPISPLHGFEYDFAVKLASFRDDIPMIARAAKRMQPDAYQGYVEGRMRHGPNGNRWLDTFPLHAVGRVCEAVGIVERYGVKAQLKKLRPFEIGEAAACGYDLIQGGEVDFRAFLERLAQNFHRTAWDMKARGLYGHLHSVLATAEPELERFRQIMREVTLQTVPMPQGANFLGQITERRLHSVHSAAKEFNLQPKRLRNLLVRAGKVERSCSQKSYHRIVLDAVEMEEFAREVKQALSFKDTLAVLATERSQLGSMVECGILRRFEEAMGGAVVPREGSSLSVTTSFLRADVEELGRRLVSFPEVPVVKGLVKVKSAAKMANCKNGNVVRLLLDGGLKEAVRIEGSSGLAAIRVNPDEVRRRTLGPTHDCHSLREVELAIPATSQVVNALIEGGHLVSVKRQNPWKRHMQTVIERKELARFIATFVSLGSLAYRNRRTTDTIERRLAAATIFPVFVASRKKFYRVRDVQDFAF